LLRVLLKYLFLFLVLAHVAFFGYYGVKAYNQVFEPRQIDPADNRFTIAEGASLAVVLERLRGRSLAPAPLFVRATLALHRRHIVVKKGTYQLPETASTWEILQQFHEGRVLRHKLTLAEGLDKWQTAGMLGQSRWGDEAAFSVLLNRGDLIRDLDPQATDLEGYLFPETYFFEEEATPARIVETLVAQFAQHTESMRARLPEAGLTVREWVTLASLIEKETSVPEERAAIASVFRNRLRRGMLLQCDPTIIYSLKLHHRYRGRIYQSDIRYDHPYNTYVYMGLPPGPIASPGLDSLRAALEPASTSFLYFVARADGTHQFSRTLAEHNRAVAQYRRGL